MSGVDLIAPSVLGKALWFIWVVGALYTWGRVANWMRRDGRNPVSAEGAFSAAGCIVIWPVILGYVDGRER